MSNDNASDAIGWNFDNSYARLPEHFYTRMHPVSVSEPEIVIANHALADEVGLTLNSCPEKKLAQLLSGNRLPAGSEPLAQAYAGHQFGHFTVLGDGRAHLIGEHVTPEGKRVDIQLKGSGRTPYGIRGDGRAALGPMLREYIISEAMHALGAPSTRSLAVVATGEPVYREAVLQGAILTRIAASHLRVGTFEYLAAQKNVEGLRRLADYAIDRHYPALKTSGQPYLGLIRAVMERQIALIADWMRVGFIHGVMNTDNMTISGETIDYGPCAFMDSYDPQTVFSSIDHMRRYAYANQPRIAQWNLARFAEALLPLLHENRGRAAALAEEAIQSFDALFQVAWLAMMRRKLGLFSEQKPDEEKEDSRLIGGLLKWMRQYHSDYTNTFHDLISENMPNDELYRSEEFRHWWQCWRQRLEKNRRPITDSLALMRANNPAVIPRNHKVEEALSAAEAHSDFSKLHALLQALSKPYSAEWMRAEFRLPPRPEERVYQTFCGT